MFSILSHVFCMTFLVAILTTRAVCDDVPQVFEADPAYQEDEAFALSMDENDPLKSVREKFHIPKKDGKLLIYFNGNSLGLQPVAVARDMQQELEDWADLGVEGHFKQNDPWYTFHEQFAPFLAKIVGAKVEEVVAMNTLTVNLHLMLATFYQPTTKIKNERVRAKIMMEAPVFSSDTYAIQSKIKLHDLDPNHHLIIVEPSQKDGHLSVDALDRALTAHNGDVGVVVLSAVNFLTGQFLDISKIAEVVHKHGAILGLDLAHAIGNIPLKLHDWNVDFAVWCSYKYLNAGPGAVAGAFIHEKHAKNINLKRLAGWWGNDPEKRFRLHLERDFTPISTADGWQISNPPIFSLVPLKASLKIYDDVGMEAYRAKSLKLTGYLEYMLQPFVKEGKLQIFTPMNPDERGCQLSISLQGPKEEAKKFHDYLKENNIIVDFRQPNVIRIAPVPFYNGFHEVWRFAKVARAYFDGAGSNNN